MKIRVERDSLADAVAWSARTLPNRPSLPVLAGLVITASDSHVALSGFDYEVSTRASIQADVETEGSVWCPADCLPTSPARCPHNR